MWASPPYVNSVSSRGPHQGQSISSNVDPHPVGSMGNPRSAVLVPEVALGRAGGDGSGNGHEPRAHEPGTLVSEGSAGVLERHGGGLEGLAGLVHGLASKDEVAGTEGGVEPAAETGDEDGIGTLFAQEVGKGPFACLTRARDLAPGTDRARFARRGRHDEEAHESPRPPSVPSAARTPSRGLAMVAPTAVAS